MATYRSANGLKGKVLAVGDGVIFKVGGEEMTHTVMQFFLNNTGGDNYEVFDELDIDKEVFAKLHYGGDNAGGDWPCPVGGTDAEKMVKLTRIVMALFLVIEKKLKPNQPLPKGWLKGEKAIPVSKASVFKAGMSVNEYVRKELSRKDVDDERRKWLNVYLRCILPDRVRKELEAAITVVLRRDVFEKWGLTTHFEKGITNSILMYGPPGTGKTMVSESIAAILGMNLMTVSSGDIQSSIPGKTEQNIRAAFKKATEEECVLLLDECDGMLADRNNVGHIMAAEINELLTQIERFSGVVIMTTNRLHHLDPALQRRIVAKVRLENPTREARSGIWRSSLPPKMPLGKDVSVEKLADVDLTGGEIKNAVLLAARMAIAENERKVGMRHFVSAIEGVVEAKREYAKTRPRAVGSGVVRKVMA